jgi:hypothetical protein
MSTQPRIPSHANRREAVAGAPGFEIERRLMGYTYAKNGNAHNASPRYRYSLYLDGRLVDNSVAYQPLVKAATATGARAAYNA